MRAPVRTFEAKRFRFGYRGGQFWGKDAKDAKGAKGAKGAKNARVSEGQAPAVRCTFALKSRFCSRGVIRGTA